MTSPLPLFLLLLVSFYEPAVAQTGRSDTFVSATDGAAAALTMHSAGTTSGTRRCDDRVVGIWSHQVQPAAATSGFTTVLYFDFVSDGRYGRYSNSSGSGADWTYTSAAPELLQQGRWYTENGVLYLQPEGQAQFMAAVKYEVFGIKLITEDEQGQKVWKRE